MRFARVTKPWPLASRTGTVRAKATKTSNGKAARLIRRRNCAGMALLKADVVFLSLFRVQSFLMLNKCVLP
jgi:hypothetical protein